jgi:uncharacterized protein
MKFEQDILTAATRITGYGPDHVLVNGQRHESSLLLGTAGVEAWDCASLQALTSSHLDYWLAQHPELVLLGTGRQLRFPDVALASRLHAHGCGLEVMDTAAACRTWNLLLAEGRRALAALILER